MRLRALKENQDAGCWLFGFYGTSILVGHSTPNSVCIYIHSQPKI